MGRAAAFLAGAGGGAGLMYWFDPDRGRRRRAVTRDKAMRFAHEEELLAEKGARDLAQRRKGALHRVRALFRNEQAQDEILAERVRATLGRFCSHPHAIAVAVRGGRASLAGPILAREAVLLLAAARRVPGVREVDDRLERHERAANVPGLQGPEARVPRRRPLIRGDYWMPAVRLVMGGLGFTTGLAGFARGGRLGRALGLFGSLLALRAATNTPVRLLFGVGRSRRPLIALQKTLTIHAPVHEVYGYFRNFENFGAFMDHVKQVRVHDGRSTWKVRGPAGRTLGFEVEVTRDAPDRLLCWRTLPGQVIDHAGIVHFEKLDERTTRLDIRLSYNPPAGELGHLVAELFRVDPKRALDEDLLRFKSILEGGKTRAHGHAVGRDDLRPS